MQNAYCYRPSAVQQRDALRSLTVVDNELFRSTSFLRFWKKQYGVHPALTNKLFRDKVFYGDAGEEIQTSVRQSNVNCCLLRERRLRSRVAMRCDTSTTGVVPTDRFSGLVKLTA
mgnify:CR=1 FL=1